MDKGRHVSIEYIEEKEANYIIRDSVGITVGRVFIISLDKDNRNIILRLKFYKNNKEQGKLIEDALKLILEVLIRKNNIHKINIICDENITLNPFTNLGFTLEGFLSDNVITAGNYSNTLLFGITEEEYNKNFITKEFVLEGKNIRIKVLTPNDAEEILNYYKKNRNYLSKFEPHRDEDFYKIETQTQSLIENYKQFFKDEGAHFGIYQGDKFIGRIRLYNIVYGVFRSGFIGYSIDEAYQGKGYMKEAVSLVVDYGFQFLNLHRIEASTLVENKKSQGVLKGCGFLELGVSERYLYINGKWRDHVIFYKVNE
ncbi:GNAT family N-acetyltransferase [Clostridium sp. UBA4548]|uniref:GNAT family N-acetyltransferase n=1 Tax=Clostridium sp. UBA4548 TaxID=1946361 RepID=UPI0025C49E2F|nr:GNAT family protein [Clostridium sp. UBA4548]